MLSLPSLIPFVIAQCAQPQMATTSTALTALYIQLFGLGIFWITLHCGGMCGPIVAGLIHYEIPRNLGAHTLLSKFKGVLLYQLGRALTYASMGAVLGGMGFVMDAQTRRVTRVAGLVAALILMCIALKPLWKRLFSKRFETTSAQPERLGRWMRYLQRRLPSKGPTRMFFYGSILGLMPCMLMFWVMQLAVASAHPLHGAALMACLVLMTTPTLLIAAALTQLKTKRGPWTEWLISAGMMISALWVGLMTMAANGWIDHVHTSIMILNKPYMLMLF